MSDVAASSAPAKADGRARFRVGCGILAGIRVAIIGGALLGLAECFVRVVVLHKYFDEGGWPWDLIVAACGKFSITHFLIWISILPICGLIYKLVFRRSDRAGVEPFLMAVMLVLTGLFLVRPAMLLATIKGRFLLDTCRVLAVILALVCYALVRYLYRRTARDRIKRLVRISVVIAILLYAGCGYVFYESPFLHLSEFKASVEQPGSNRPDRPHILWIDLDTVRSDHMSCYGNKRKTTPFLEELATTSVVFDRAVADGMWTVPTHASMFTGKSVRQHGMDWGNLRLDDDHVTIADRLSELGYQSLFLANNVWLTRKTQLVKGFHDFKNIYHIKRLDLFSMDLLLQQWGITPFLPWFDMDFGAAIANHFASDWLDTHAESGDPLFVFVNYMEAHLPYSVPKKYRRMYMSDSELDRSYDLSRTVYGILVNTLELRYNVGDGKFLADEDRDILRSQYDAGIRYLDDRAGELVHAFDDRGLLENTLIIVTSDHGEYLGTHRMWAHSAGLYDELTHVALFIREPGQTKGRRIGTPAQQSDLYGTIMRAVDGRPYVSTNPYSRDLLNSSPSESGVRMVVSQSQGASLRTRSHLLRSLDPVRRNQAVSKMAVTDGQYKYIESSDGKRELYDLREDPTELHNVAFGRPEPRQRLSRFLDEWRKGVPRYVPKQRHKSHALDRDTIDALKGLGYIGSEE